MSRKGKMPIPLPKGVEVKHHGQEVVVKGPKGSLKYDLLPGVKIEITSDHVAVILETEDADGRRIHGLSRSLLNNMITGAHHGFEKRLEMVGVGYRASVQGQMVDLQVGYSHPTKLHIPEGIAVKVDKNGTIIIISGANKQVIGQFAAQIRAIRPPEPYQGKGIRYEGEHVRRKAGKAAKK